jgi:hypothetical protein
MLVLQLLAFSWGPMEVILSFFSLKVKFVCLLIKKKKKKLELLFIVFFPAFLKL